MTAQEKQWRTESDANALTRYAEVHADPERLKSAQEHLEKQKTEIETALNSTRMSNYILASAGKLPKSE